MINRGGPEDSEPYPDAWIVEQHAYLSTLENGSRIGNEYFQSDKIFRKTWPGGASCRLLHTRVEVGFC
ncbi:hypothetical protein EAH74_23035 [Pseudomonas mandelii]|uniref:Uncharacterized protein n=1 Tax=Pseudomonas mandelii TaxID=75612 RepID=A0A502I3X3_9PSED|nr:hypothetical protein EAH74_23035 [Pseudomonas mandelii]